MAGGFDHAYFLFARPVDQSGHAVYTVRPAPELDRRPGIGI
jgi:hypothetical protein